MKKWEKRYIGNAMRWGLFALIGAMAVQAAIICALVPDSRILKYRGGHFFYLYPRTEYDWISTFILSAAAVLCLFCVVWEFITKQRIADKIVRSLLTLILGSCVFVSFVISAAAFEGFALFPEWNLPFGAEEYNMGGHLLLLCSSPDGLHHSHPALCEVQDEVVHYLGSGEMYRGRAEDFRVTPTETGYTVTYTETINGVREQRSFTAERRELSE